MGRTALLIAVAAVLGIVAGTCTGYVVQAGREPTKLPSLSQPALRQAKGQAPEPLSAERDRRVKTDGDLRRLLLKKPAGAKDAEWLEGSDGWLDLAGYADYYEQPDKAFGDLVGDEFRRAAITGWEVGDSDTVEILLIQFRQEEGSRPPTARPTASTGEVPGRHPKLEHPRHRGRHGVRPHRAREGDRLPAAVQRGGIRLAR
ncbi:hypothetical protein ACFQ0G_47425 [Streptomyces chiangmaiensis]